MHRVTGIPRIAILFFCLTLPLAAAPAFAQGWPTYASGNPDKHFIDRGPPGSDTGGWYLATYKLVLFFLVFVFWVRSADWVNRDLMNIGERVGLDYQIWNAAVALPFIVGFFFFGLCFPFFVGFPLMLITYLAPFVAYVVHRNSLVRTDEKVFTPRNVSDWF